MSPLICLGFAGAAALAGRLDAAAILLCGFDGMLRTQSLFLLRRGHVEFVGSRAVIKLARTKTTEKRGGVELIVIQSTLAAMLLRLACAGLAPDDYVLRMAPSSFRWLFAQLIATFGLTDANLAVYSLRRGGASWDFLQHGSMEKTLLRGHWQSTATARIYVQDAAAEITSLRLPAEAVAQLRIAARTLRTL